MAAKNNQLTRIFNSLDKDFITVTVKTRANADESWQDAQVTDSRSFDVSLIADELANGEKVIYPKTYGIWKGLSERISDGKSITEKLELMDAHFANWQETSNWKVATVRKTSNGSDTYLISALMQLKGLSLSQATGAVKNLSREQVDKLRANPQVADLIAKEKAVAAESLDSLDDLLGDSLEEVNPHDSH